MKSSNSSIVTILKEMDAFLGTKLDRLKATEQAERNERFIAEIQELRSILSYVVEAYDCYETGAEPLRAENGDGAITNDAFVLDFRYEVACMDVLGQLSPYSVPTALKGTPADSGAAN